MIFGNKFPYYQQLESKDCGPACLQMLCKYYGSFYELEYLRELTGIKKEGISVYDFIVASEKLGFRSLAFRVSYRKFREEVPLPCTIHWHGNHFVVVYKITKNNIYVSDPKDGLKKYSLKEFAKGWLAHIEENTRNKMGICIVSEKISDSDMNMPKKKKDGYMDTVKYIWRYMKNYKGSVAKVCILMVIIAFVSVLLPIITQSIIDRGIPTKDYNFILLMMISCIVLTLSISISTWIKQLINTHFAVRVKMSMQSDFISKLFNLPITFFENRLMGDIMQRTYDYDRMESMLMSSGLNSILATMQLLLFGCILYFYNSTILWVFVIAGILYVAWILLFWSIRKKMDIRYFSYLAYNQSHWIEMLTNMTDVKSYNYGTDERWRWEKVQIKLFKTRIKLLNVDQLQNTGAMLLNSFRDVILIYIASISVMEGSMTFGMLIAVQFILGQLRIPLEDIINFIVSLQLSNISYMRISEINTLTTEENANSIDNKLINYCQELNLHNIYFKYSINDDYVLRNISVIIPKEKFTVIVGENGCGKSTLIKLLMKLYLPSSGYISVGAQHLESISTEDWRRKCGSITQDSSLLKDSILNNILFGREFDQENFLKAVDIAGINIEIEEMPLSYNTMIRESGKGVSAGLKQRIMFARSIYNNPEFLFLDEVTSALDPRNERMLINSLNEYKITNTIVMVAHRLSSVKDADNIIVMKKGMIVEVGTHSNLMTLKREYYQLFISQMNQ